MEKNSHRLTAQTAPRGVYDVSFWVSDGSFLCYVQEFDGSVFGMHCYKDKIHFFELHTKKEWVEDWEGKRFEVKPWTNRGF